VHKRMRDHRPPSNRRRKHRRPQGAIKAQAGILPKTLRQCGNSDVTNKLFTGLTLCSQFGLSRRSRPVRRHPATISGRAFCHWYELAPEGKA